MKIIFSKRDLIDQLGERGIPNSYTDILRYESSRIIHAGHKTPGCNGLIYTAKELEEIIQQILSAQALGMIIRRN